MEPISLPRAGEIGGDGLDNMFPSFLRGKNEWDSSALRCPSSGTILHLLSLSCRSDDDGKSKEGVSADLSLISITPGIEGGQNATEEVAVASVKESRRLLAHRVHEVSHATALAIKIKLYTALGQKIDASQLLGSTAKSGLPFLHLPTSVCGNSVQPVQYTGDDDVVSSPFRLRELVLPYSGDATYEDGSSLISRLGDSALSRPRVGLYQWPQNGVAFRPLPAAKEDLTLPPPSLVFSCESLDNAQRAIDDVGATSAKVGFSGHDRKGQLIVKHKLLAGLDFRMCEAENLSSTFAEAEQSLLAGSLDDLQNDNVMAEGGKRRGSSDAMNGLGDCWVEFRANIRNPSGFWKKDKTTLKRIAKAPPLPYE